MWIQSFLTKIFNRPTVIADKVDENTNPINLDINVFSWNNDNTIWQPIANKKETVFNKVSDFFEKNIENTKVYNILDKWTDTLFPKVAVWKEVIKRTPNRIDWMANLVTTLPQTVITWIQKNNDKKKVVNTLLWLMYSNDKKQRNNVYETFSMWKWWEDQSLESLKLELQNIWVPWIYLEQITQDKLQGAINKDNKSLTELESKWFDIETKDIKWSFLSSINSEIEWFQWLDRKSAIPIANAISVYNPEIKNIEDVKRSMINNWVSEEYVNKITTWNIDKIYDKYTIWRDDRSIIETNTDGSFTKDDWLYRSSYDAEWNMISTEMSKSLSTNNKKLSALWLQVDTFSDLWARILENVVKNNPWARWNQINAIAMSALSATLWERDETIDHLVWTMRLIENAQESWNTDLASTLTTRLKEDIKVMNLWMNNLNELVDIKIENKLQWWLLKKYIKEEYNMSIDDFMKRDENGKVMDTEWLPVPDYIISRQVDSDAIDALKTTTQGTLQRWYRIATDWLSNATESFKKIPIHFQKWTVQAQIEDIGSFDPIPWYQPGELATRSVNSFLWWTDEAFALFAPDIILWFVSWWTSLVWEWVRLAWKWANAMKMVNTANRLIKYWDTIKDLNKYAKWFFNVANKAWEADKLGMYRWLITNLWMWLVRDLNGEARWQRLDPQRWNDFNVNFAITTMMIPWMLDWWRLIKSLRVWEDWISNIDILKTLAMDSLDSSWKIKTADRWMIQWYKKWRIKNIKDAEKIYNWLDAEWKKLYKTMLWAGILSNKMVEKEMFKNLGKAQTFWTAWLAISDIEAFAMQVGRALKNVWDPETQALTRRLAEQIANKEINFVDMLKEAYNLPQTVTLWNIRSTIQDSPEMLKNFDIAIKQAINNWTIDTLLKYVWWNDEFYSQMVQSVFWNRFLPSKQFSIKELDSAASKSWWTPLSDMFIKWDNWKYNELYRNFEDWKYTLNNNWLSKMMFPVQPSKIWLESQLWNWDYEWAARTISAYIWENVSNIVASEKLIRKIDELFSSKIC